MTDLSYKDRREDAYRNEFSEYRYNLDRPTLTEEHILASGREVVRMDLDNLIRTLERQAQMIRTLQQDILSLRGQLEEIHKNGLDSYNTKITAIRDAHPKPTDEEAS